MKRAFITGVTGQDGSYLAELLLEKGYEVHGLVRRISTVNNPNIEHIKNDLILHNGDLTDSAAISNCLASIQPDEVYNLAAQSHVKLSFEMPIATAEIDGIGPLRILEAIRSVKLNCKFYQASTSEMFGTNINVPQNETTPFHPGSPYGVAKLYAHWIVANYRSSYNMFASTGILYNHESPRRGEMFVTRKITKAFANILRGKQDCVELGNLDSLRDWGHAKDYVEAMWLILQHHEPDDFVIATGEQITIREFCNLVANYFGVELTWEETGLNEVARDKNGKVWVRINEKYYRPVDVVNLLGDPTKAKSLLNWKPKYNLASLVAEMCEEDFKCVGI
jgi:GDPmannose 4,6-dehydratase